jgi:hypothetical protein
MYHRNMVFFRYVIVNTLHKGITRIIKSTTTTIIIIIIIIIIVEKRHLYTNLLGQNLLINRFQLKFSSAFHVMYFCA